MSFPFYRQHDAMDCGPACLKMIAKHYGKTITLEEMRERAQMGKEGVNLLGISEAAESIGFRTRAVKLSLKFLLRDSSLPCILHWDQSHFVVLYKVKGKKVYLADPTLGLVHMGLKELREHWISDIDQLENNDEVGITLFLEPTPRFFELEDEKNIAGSAKAEKLAYNNIFNYLIPYKKLVFQLIIGLAVSSLLQLMLPFLAQSVIDVGVNTANIHFVYIVLIAQLSLFIGRLVADFVRSWILLHMSSRINISILTDFLIKLMKLPVSFFDTKQTGDLLQRMNDHNRIEAFLTGSSITVFFSFANLAIYSVVLAVFNASIFVVFMVASVLYSIWVVIFLKRRRILDYKRFDIASREQGATIQMVQGMQEIKLNGIERRMRWAWERLQAKLFRLNMKGLALNQWQQSGAVFINEGKNIFITFLSAKAVIDGQMTLGTMLAVQYIIGQLNSPIEQMIGFMQSWQNAKISMDRLNEIHGLEDEEPSNKYFLQELPASFVSKISGGRRNLEFNDLDASAFPNYEYAGLEAPKIQNEFPVNRNHEIYNENDDEEMHREGNGLRFCNVSFSYAGAGNEPVLRHINLQIPKGQTTAIVGVSGSGKTTLLKLLLKFYQPQKGDIKLNHTSLENISHRVWRSHCGVVMQESFIFSDTISRNIVVGADKIDMDKLNHAVHVANVNEFIESLPLGYNTKIGAEGTGISMGQRQRILIARAVYRDPEYIFFDEATNSLDANNESIILNNLESFFKGKTVVVVAHRLSTVKNADQIVVLHNGTISEKGTHRELVNLRGEYYTLVRNQLELGQ
jgi:ATP-binding cassette, subfamily B, bacterial